jgi:hypothetical protein
LVCRVKRVCIAVGILTASCLLHTVMKAQKTVLIAGFYFKQASQYWGGLDWMSAFSAEHYTFAFVPESCTKLSQQNIAMCCGLVERLTKFSWLACLFLSLRTSLHLKKGSAAKTAQPSVRTRSYAFLSSAIVSTSSLLAAWVRLFWLFVRTQSMNSSWFPVYTILFLVLRKEPALVMSLAFLCLAAYV